MKALIEKSVIEFHASSNYDKAKRDILEVCITIEHAQIAVDYSVENYRFEDTENLVRALLSY